MTWQGEVDELRRREELAQKMGGEERVKRQHDTGRLTVRERIGKLLDPDSFEEWGGLAGFAAYGENAELKEFTPANARARTGRRSGFSETPATDRRGTGTRYGRRHGDNPRYRRNAARRASPPLNGRHTTGSRASGSQLSRTRRSTCLEGTLLSR